MQGLHEELLQQDDTQPFSEHGMELHVQCSLCALKCSALCCCPREWVEDSPGGSAGMQTVPHGSVASGLLSSWDGFTPCAWTAVSSGRWIE